MKILNTYTQQVPYEIMNGENALVPVTHVLIEDEDDEGVQVVRVGIGSAEFIAEHGLKLTFMQATAYYPILEEHKYGG